MAWQIPTLVILLLVVLGPLGAMTGTLGPGTGFQTFLSGVFLAALSALALGGAAAFASATGRVWRRRALVAAAVPLVVLLAVLLPAMMSGGDHPIHDVTTDLEDGLGFPPDVAAREAEAPRAEVLAQQRELYPDIAPIELDEPPARAYELALAAARTMPRWSILASDPAARTIHAVAVSRVFRFRDDVIIRVTPAGDGARIDIRSRSRIGQSDLGANAARIRTYLAALAG